MNAGLAWLHGARLRVLDGVCPTQPQHEASGSLPEAMATATAVAAVTVAIVAAYLLGRRHLTRVPRLTALAHGAPPTPSATPRTAAEARSGFAYFDTNQDGRIDFAEMVQALAGKAGSERPWPLARIRFVFGKFDTDGDGYLSGDEFSALYHYLKDPDAQGCSEELACAWALVEDSERSDSERTSYRASAELVRASYTREDV